MLDTALGDEQIGTVLRTSIGLDRMRVAWAERRERLLRHHGRLSMLDESMSTCVSSPRPCWPRVRFARGPGTE